MWLCEDKLKGKTVHFRLPSEQHGGEQEQEQHGGEITRLGGDFDCILVASLLVASLPRGEMTSYRHSNIRRG